MSDVVLVDCWVASETVFEVSLKAGLDLLELTFFDKLELSKKALVIAFVDLKNFPPCPSPVRRAAKTSITLVDSN